MNYGKSWLCFLMVKNLKKSIELIFCRATARANGNATYNLIGY